MSCWRITWKRSTRRTRSTLLRGSLMSEGAAGRSSIASSGRRVLRMAHVTAGIDCNNFLHAQQLHAAVPNAWCCRAMS